MKYMTIIALCLFVMGISVVAFAEQPAQVNQQEQKIESEAAAQGETMQEAKDLPSTMMTGEEKRPSYMQEVEELQDRYVYEEEWQDD
jgi:predicted  nucleic acid-binding Zn-ribbon protein